MALDNALEFVGGFEDVDAPKLVFLHVINLESNVPDSERDRMIELKEEKIKDEFETISEMAEERGVTDFETIIEEGKPDEKIIETAEMEEVDLIIMGSGKLHDRSATGRIRKFVYGSITEDVIHETSCSVLVSRP